jgi:hypothetical protein
VTNNQAKVLTLYRGLKLLDSRWIRELVVIGDFAIIIRYMHNLYTSSNCKLERLISRIQLEVRQLHLIESFHVLRAQN